MSQIVFSPPLPASIMTTAREMLPPGFELDIVDPDPQKLLPALKDAEYYVGFARTAMDKSFFAAAELSLLLVSSMPSVNVPGLSRLVMVMKG